MATKTNPRTPWPAWLKKLGAKLSEQRDAAGMTNDQLAQLCGVSRWTVSRWMAGSYPPPVIYLYAMAGAFKVDLEHLMPRFRRAR